MEECCYSFTMDNYFFIFDLSLPIYFIDYPLPSSSLAFFISAFGLVYDNIAYLSILDHSPIISSLTLASRCYNQYII